MLSAMGYGAQAQLVQLLVRHWKPFLLIVVPAVLLVWVVLPVSVAVWVFIVAFVAAVLLILGAFLRNLRRGWRGD